LVASNKTLQWDRVKTKELFRVLRSAGDSKAREELIRSYINLVEYLAGRFRNRGEPLDDLIQVGTIGLMKAVDRFDPDREVEFTTYATPTIVGELKRYFRDKTWAIRVPRRLQELSLQINHIMGQLTQQLGKSPTIDEIAEHIDATAEEVVEALETGQAYNFVSLDKVMSNDDDDRSFSLIEYLGQEDKALQSTEDRTSIAAAISTLSKREQRIVYLRFFKGLTQTEIAITLKISQMHVSRLIRRTLDSLRNKIKE
jgi:RNA polymerase sigma-B factor